MPTFTDPRLKIALFWSAFCATLFAIHALSGMSFFFWLGCTAALFTVVAIGIFLFSWVFEEDRVLRPVDDLIFLFGYWAGFGFFSIPADPDLGADIAAKFGLMHVTTGHTLIIGLSSLFLTTIAMIPMMKRYSRASAMNAMKGSTGVVTVGQDGTYGLRLEHVATPWWKSKPKKDWEAVASDETLATGDQVKVIGADGDYKKPKVVKADPADAQEKPNDELSAIKLLPWIVLSSVFFLAASTIPVDYLTIGLYGAAAITIACPLTFSTRKLRGNKKWTMKRKLIFWSVVMLAYVAGCVAYETFSYFSLAETPKDLDNVDVVAGQQQTLSISTEN